MKLSKTLLATALAAGILGGGIMGSPAMAAPSFDPAAAPVEQRQEAFTTVADLDQTQIDNARTIIGVGRGGALPDQGIVIALMTAMQESSMYNLDYGDRDSLGLFQQRPSMGWGAPEQVTDPVYASKSFYGINPEGSNPGLIQINGWESMAPTQAAQAVQRSAYPDAYAKWEPLARELLAAHGDAPAIP
ncbi:peptidoglycan-binding protein [Brevibacterium luteolum]|uniref:Peptidoglycan-binding protein n=1 Tax=Brevibacterium luteolum TaxID=199591 RepID=A0A6G8KXG7_9MICO|nr:peptidoglycan-binding protein [Brevibacterium luteolum]MBU8578098.1 peptidoglycan-binding protein [Brevibacterium luteolum]QIN29498.1 peptidoglycan-binding protein [Brevibacterium luteolum]